MTTPEEKHLFEIKSKTDIFFSNWQNYLHRYTNFGKSFQYSYFVKEISICYHMGCIYNK